MTSPFFVTVGAGLLLGERLTAARWTAVVIGFVGGFIVLDPWSDIFSAASFLPLGAAVMFAASSLCLKRMVADDGPAACTAWLFLLLAPINLGLALPSGLLLPGGSTLLIVASAGLLTAAAQGFLALAYARSDAAFVQPFDHVKLPLNVLAGWLVFGWIPPGNLWLGATMIVGASIYLMLREGR
jgi:drug/metabolite transporter (DMT)-like permease